MTTSVKTSNSQIAKNTLFLYVRMLLTILANLYAVRVIWQVLGVDDYGVYNVVGGIVAMFAFLNNAMIASSQRFISFELGTGNAEKLKKVFCISVTVHVLLALIILLLAETAGLWFLNAKLNIPADRMIAANWVYQCSIIAFMVNVVSVPYNACIVAHEHMKAFGYLGILEAMFKLGIVFMLMLIPGDKLIVYAPLVLGVSVTMRVIYGSYCRRNFTECRYHYATDHNLMRDMFSFAGWSFIGNLGFSVRDQGLNIILNMFFNVAVNAAKGIANQVGTVLNGFASNFTMAINPQLTKLYAAGDIQGMVQLLINGCKISLLLMSAIVVPLIFSANVLLRLWLGEIAPYTIGFLQLVLLMSLVDCVISPITTSLQATGNIRKFQIIISIIMIANIPLAWLWLKFDLNPYLVMVVAIITSVIGLIARLMLLHELIPFSYSKFIKKVYGRTIPFIFIIGCTAWAVYPLFRDSLTGIIGFFGVEWSACLILGWFIAFNKKERVLITKMVSLKLKRG